MNLDEKNKVWKEINNLTHIGRFGHDIELALIAKGYDKALLDDILTDSFMRRLINKEEMFVQRQNSANEAVKQVKKEMYEVPEQKRQEQKMDGEQQAEAKII